MNSPGLFSAALAGLLSFLSPCVLPRLPASRAFISGSRVSARSKGAGTAKLFARSLAFSAGFTLAFTILGVVFSGSAMFVDGNKASQYIGVIGGIVVIILGTNMLLDFLGFLNADSRIIAKLSGTKTKGLTGSFLLGLAFAAGWSPCIGPILASILLMASREGSIGNAAFLLLSYSLGFALPFLASGLFFEKLKPLLAFLTKKGKAVRTISGIVLILFGLAMALGSLGSLSAWAARLGYMLEDFTLSSPGKAALLGAGFWLLIAVLIVLPVLQNAADKISPGKKRHLVLAALAPLVLAGLELLGYFSTLSLIARWLSFSGI
jgi:cytochrome c-type biogenesis protein